MDAPINVWNEVRVTSDGISISLFSESRGGSAIVEDELRFTFDELQDMSRSEPINLNLSDTTVENLAEQSEQTTLSEIHDADSLQESGEHLPENPTTDELLAYMELDDMQQLSLPEVEQSDDLPEPGDVVEDANPPSWSQEDTLIVESVADETAGEYVIQESAEWTTIPDKTVADANPSCDQDEPVIEAVYTDNEQGDVYAFPLSRIE